MYDFLNAREREKFPILSARWLDTVTTHEFIKGRYKAFVVKADKIIKP